MSGKSCARNSPNPGSAPNRRGAGSACALRVALGACLTLAAAMAAVAQPRMTVRDTLIQLGELYHDTKHTRSITVRNSGNEALHIASVMSSCGCTTVQQPTHDIAPGDSAEISFTVNTAILSGKVRKNIVVTSNDPVTPARAVYYEADVINILAAVPAFVYLGEGDIRTTLSGELRLTNTTKKPVRILGVGSASGKLKFSRLPDLLAAGDTTRLTVTLTPEAPGTFKDELRIETDNEIQRTVRIGVAARVGSRK